MSQAARLEIIPLGGLGEFGMNLTVYRIGGDCLIVDAGMMFPGAEHLGIDVVIPDLTFLEDCGRLHAVVLTHGHDDHIGALPYVLARHDLPVYCTAYTRALVERRLAEQGVAARNLHLLPADGARVTCGPFEVEALPVAHSIPQSRMLVLHTSLGVVVHTADFKLDPNPPDGTGADLGRLSRLGDAGVLALLSDSTNANQPGFTPGERSVVPAFEALLAGATGRVLVTLFASHVARLVQLGRLAHQHGRRLALVGMSLETHADVAESLGLLPLPAGVRLSAERVRDLAPAETLIVASGSQGEPLSSMTRIALGKHRDIEVGAGDLVIHSARAIPGNARSIDQMFNHFLRRGAEVVTAAEAAVHVSGHPAQDELRWMLRLVRPRFFVPIHGEYRQLRAHARLAVECGVPAAAVLLAETGDLIALDGSTIAIADRVHVGQVFLDAGLEEVGHGVLRDRRRIAWDGIVVPVVAVDRQRGLIDGYPRIMTRGFSQDSESEEGLMSEARQMLVAAVADASPEERADEALLKARIQTELKRFLRRRTQRQPLIVPVIVEL